MLMLCIDSWKAQAFLHTSADAWSELLICIGDSYCWMSQNIACSGAAQQYSWDLVNGFWSLFLAFGLALTALLTRTAHSWRFGNTLARQLINDYGAPLMVRCLPTKPCSSTRVIPGSGIVEFPLKS